MDPVTLALLAGKGILGAYQMWKGSQIDTTPPKYNIPPAVSEAVELAKAGTMKTVAPGQAERTAAQEESMSRALGTAKRTAGTGAQVFGNLYRQGIMKNRAMRQDVMLNKQYQDEQMSRYVQALNQKGSYQDKAFNINKLMPYERRLGAKGALLSGGINTLAATGSDMASYNLLNKYYGGGDDINNPHEMTHRG